MPTKNHVLGRGKLYFERHTSSTTPAVSGELYFGNTPSFSLSVETEELQHFSSEEGLRIKDESVTLSINYTASFVTDNINQDNVALFFFGTKSTVTESGAAGVAEVLSAVNPDRFYQLGRTSVRPFGVRNLTNVTVTDGGATTYVEGTDYTLDATLGRIYIVEGGAITTGSDITVTYDIAAHSHHQVLSGSDLVYGGLRFISYNGVGDQQDFYMPKVALRPNGEYALKGEDWQQFGFNCEILKLDDATPNILINGRPFTP